MQKPRNPRHFPKMRVRGARRKRLAPFQRMNRQFDLMGENLGKAAEAFIKMTGVK